MSKGADRTCGPRQKWFRVAYGQPWAYGSTGNGSGRGFFLAIGLEHPAKGFTREKRGHLPSRGELLDMAKRMDYSDEDAHAVATWIASGVGDAPPPPPGVMARDIPVPGGALPKESKPAKQAAMPVVATPEVASLAGEVLHVRELASDILQESAETGVPLSGKFLELVKAVRALSLQQLCAIIRETVANNIAIKNFLRKCKRDPQGKILRFPQSSKSRTSSTRSGSSFAKA